MCILALFLELSILFFSCYFVPSQALTSLTYCDLETVLSSVLQTNRFLIWETQNIILWNYPWKVNSNKTTWQVLEIKIQRGPTQSSLADFFLSLQLFITVPDILWAHRISMNQIPSNTENEAVWMIFLYMIYSKDKEWLDLPVHNKPPRYLVIIFLTQGQWSHEF